MQWYRSSGQKVRRSLLLLSKALFERSKTSLCERRLTLSARGHVRVGLEALFTHNDGHGSEAERDDEPNEAPAD